MRLIAILVIFGIVLSGFAASLRDDDNDGYLEDGAPLDNCPGTENGAIVDGGGCSCSQKESISSEGLPWHCLPVTITGADAKCVERCGAVDSRASCNAPLDTEFRDSLADCPSDYCTAGGAMIDFPENGYDKCLDGKFVEYSCKIQKITPGHTNCTKAAKPAEETACSYNGNKIAQNTCLNAVMGSIVNSEYNLYCMCDEGPADLDGDGYSPYDAQKYDCNDEDARVNIGAQEICSNNVDDDCDGSVNDGCGKFCDEDKDGYYSDKLSGLQQSVCDFLKVILKLKGGNDCDDSNPYKYQNAEEKCDYIDNNCDGIDDSRHFSPNKEICDKEQKDEDCDGERNEGCECIERDEQIIFGKCRDGRKICRSGKWETVAQKDDGINDICRTQTLVAGREISGFLKEKIEVGKRFEVSAAFICEDKNGCGDVTAVLK